jgi:hypothetical protein
MRAGPPFPPIMLAIPARADLPPPNAFRPSSRLGRLAGLLAGTEVIQAVRLFWNTRSEIRTGTAAETSVIDTRLSCPELRRGSPERETARKGVADRLSSSSRGGRRVLLCPCRCCTRRKTCATALRRPRPADKSLGDPLARSSPAQKLVEGGSG